MEQLGFNRNLIVLTQPDGYRKHKSKAFALMKRMLKKYPAVAEAMAVRHEMYNRQMEEISRREKDGISLVIRPPEALKIGHTEKNPAELDRVYQLGRREAAKRLPEICQFLEK